jgi:hypothetical protein
MSDKPPNFMQRRILDFLDALGGSLTGDIARNTIGRGRRESAEMRQHLLTLELRGWVEPADDKKPVVWCRTKAGTEALKLGRQDVAA